MDVIEVSVNISASRDRVWDLVSDLDAEPEFWRGTKSVRNVSRDGNKVVREVTIAFRNKKCMQEVTLEPKSAIRTLFTEGIIKGSKSITISDANGGTLLRARWEIALTGSMGLFSRMITRHIRSGTEQALHAIKESAEG